MFAFVAALIIAPLSLTADRIYRALRFSEAEQAELLASAEHRAYEDARLEAAESERAFGDVLVRIADGLSAELNSTLAPNVDPSG